MITSKLLIKLWKLEITNRKLLFYLHSITGNDDYEGYFNLFTSNIHYLDDPCTGLPSYALEKLAELRLGINCNDLTVKNEAFVYMPFGQSDLNIVNIDYDFLVIQQCLQMTGCGDYVSFVKGNIIQEYYYEQGTGDSLLKTIVEIVIGNNPNKSTDDVVNDITRSFNHPLRMLIEIANINDNKFASYALLSTVIGGIYNNLVLFKYTKYTI